MRRNFDKTRYMYFLIKYENIFDKEIKAKKKKKKNQNKIRLSLYL